MFMLSKASLWLYSCLSAEAELIVYAVDRLESVEISDVQSTLTACVVSENGKLLFPKHVLWGENVVDAENRFFNFALRSCCATM